MTEPLRVLQITSRLNVGGLARLVVSATDGLNARGFDCRLVTGRISEAEGDFLAVERRDAKAVLVIDELGRNPSAAQDAAALRKLLALVRAFRPHVVHTHAAKAGTLGRIAATVTRVPVRVHSFHGHVFAGYFNPIVSKGVALFERGLSLVSDAIVVPGESQKREISRVYGVAPEQKVRIVPYGIDVDHYRSVAQRRAGARANLGVPQDARVVAAVGRLAAVKNHDLLLDAFDMLGARPGMDDVRLLIVGGGERKAAILERIAQSPFRDRIGMSGFVEDLRDAYAAMDVLALTSLNEGMPVAVMEAMAAGVAVVATRAGGVVDLVEEGRNGLLAGDYAPATFASVLERALAGESLRAQLAARARLDIVERHSDAAHLDALERLYRELLERAGAISR